MGGPVTSLAFHQDGDILASGSENNLIALWNLSPPQIIGDPIAGSDAGVTGLAFSTDNSALYSASDKGTAPALEPGGMASHRLRPGETQSNRDGVEAVLPGATLSSHL